jgi:signal transduction histidine kinase
MLDENTTRLLIVDDLPENLQALNAIIRAEDRIVHQAQSGEAALDLLLEHEFALAILDVQMPGMNGFELAEMMRGTQKTRHIPIIFVTAAATELNYAFQGYETGAVDFLYKPLNIEAVKSKVNVFVALCKQRNEIQRQLAALKHAREEQDILLKELRSTQAELERSINMRDEFMSMVAHELRTPLNTLVLDAQVRKIQLEGGINSMFQPAVLQKMLEKNDHQLQNMIRLIDDMLDVTRMRNGKLSIRPAPTELSGLLKRVADDFAPHAEVNGSTITLHASEPVTGNWDEFRIEQIIINLLTNALRYGAGKPIEVGMDVSKKHVRIEIKDEGIGISEEDQKRIFDPFERAAGNRAPAGLGLGLYISRQLAEAHGGNLSVQSSLQQGSVFTLLLPL